MVKHELAIVLPAWKSDFLEKSLRSLELQTNRNFRLYIFDDAAPAEISAIIRPFMERNPDWLYHRFEENLGRENLAAHWNRCIRMCGEKWIWLFSDDDEAEKSCTAAFYESKNRFPDHKVYRFPFSIINEKGEVQPVKSSTEQVLSGAEFGKMRFLRKLDSSAVEFVFSRDVFEANGGFPEFPAGWCADDAAWILFSGHAGIGLMEGGGVRWRWSEKSISGSVGIWTVKKLDAALRFINWYNTRFPIEAWNSSFRAEQVIWLRLQMVHQHYQPGFFQVLFIIRKLGISGIVNRLRCFQDLYCLSYVYHKRVVQKQKPGGIRLWLSLLLPAY